MRPGRKITHYARPDKNDTRFFCDFVERINGRLEEKDRKEEANCHKVKLEYENTSPNRIFFAWKHNPKAEIRSGRERERKKR